MNDRFVRPIFTSVADGFAISGLELGEMLVPPLIIDRVMEISRSGELYPFVLHGPVGMWKGDLILEVVEWRA